MEWSFLVIRAEEQDSTSSTGMERASLGTAALGTVVFKVSSPSYTVDSFLDRKDSTGINGMERTSPEFEASGMVVPSSC